MEGAQASLQIIRTLIDAEFNNLLRTLPPHIVYPTAEEFDALLKRTLA